MTVPTATRRSPVFAGNDATTAFPFAYKVFATSDLDVVLTDADGALSTLALDSDYSVALNADQTVSPGGTVTYPLSGSPLATGETLVILGALPYDQTLSLPGGGNFNPVAIERNFDRTAMQIQQINDRVDASVRAPVGEELNELPAATSRANRMLGFNSAGHPMVLAPAAGSAAAVLTDLVNGADPSKGDALVAVKRTLAGAVAHTQHDRNEHDSVIATVDFDVPNDGTSATTAIQAMFDACAADGVSDIYFPPGTYLLPCNRTDADYTCAVIISGLRNCRVHGAKTAKFIVDATGSGPAEFGMFRVEQCENVEFCGFEMDGSGITINGIGANRSRGFVLVNYDVNSKATNLAVTNKRIEFHHIYAHDIGGFVGVPPRTSTLAATPYTDVLTVRDCTGANLIGQDHFVGVSYVRNLYVGNNRCVNDIVTKTPIDNMMVDASSGCENCLIENNYAYGFLFGAKCETATGVGPSGTEIRPSKNITFLNNTFEEIGDPTQFTIPGPSGGDTYGIKINGINCKAIGNTIMPRTVGVTAGGLAGAIQAVGTHADNSHNLVEGNFIGASQYGINHNDTTPTTRKSTYLIRGNRCIDNITFGVIAASNVVVEENHIHRAGASAIKVQSPNNTIVRRNTAYNCAAVDNDIVPERVVYYQEGGGAYAGFQEWTDNIIIDDRGGGAAEYGYFIRGGTTYANVLIFRPGYTTGLLTGISYDTYVSALGLGMQRNATLNPARREFQVTNNPAATAPWNGMAWNPGDRGVLMPPVVGSPKAWICTVGGTPGTWVSEGNL